MDAENLVVRFGPAPAVRSILPRMRCTRCGHPGGEITISAHECGPARGHAVVVVDRNPPWTPLLAVRPAERML